MNLQDNNGAEARALISSSAGAPAPSVSWWLTLPPATSSASAVAVCPYAAARHKGDQPARGKGGAIAAGTYD